MNLLKMTADVENASSFAVAFIFTLFAENVYEFMFYLLDSF